MVRLASLLSLVLGLSTFAACAADDPAEDGPDDAFTTDGKVDGFTCTPAEAAAILAVANTAPQATLATDVGLAPRAVDNILAYRVGDDEQPGTADDQQFATLGALDAVPYIGPIAFHKLLAYVHAKGLVADQAPRTWHLATVASGAGAAVALAPNGKPVVAFTPAGASQLRVLLPTGTQVDLPADAQVSTNWNFQPRVAVDSTGAPHVFYQPVNHFGSWNHASYRNGAWTQHGAISSYPDLVVNNGPGGQVFAIESHPIPNTNYRIQYTLHTIAANGTDATETLWSADDYQHLALAVDLAGYPSLLWHDQTVQAGYRGPTGWRTSSTTYVDSVGAFATSGGASPTVVVNGLTSQPALHVYRSQAGTMVERSTIAHQSDFGRRMDAVSDAQGIVHVCLIEKHSLLHLQLDPAGGVTTETVGVADTCKLALDKTGKLHLLYTLGSVINHGTYE